MSDILEKTLVSLQSLVSKESSPGHHSKTSGKWEQQWSRKFLSFVNSICSADTKEKENKIVAQTAVSLKQALSNPKITSVDTKECIAEAVICELLGHPMPFVYILAVKLADSNNFSIKRMGYLAVAFFLNSKHEFILLLVNTLQKDLKSNNVLEITMALAVVCELIDEEYLPAVLPLVEDRLAHSNPNVRKKAAYCIQCMASKSRQIVLHVVPKLTKLLADPDPSVMIAALQSLVSFIQSDPDNFKHLLPSLLQVQEMIVHFKLPKDLNYHAVPAPWCQILVLKILSIFGKNDEGASKSMWVTLKKTLMQSEINENIAFGIVCECIHTIASIESSPELIELSLSSITSLLKSQNSNLKYMGLEALTMMITKVKNCFASKHQPAVIECLHHPDSSIRLKTLDLLYHLCNNENVTVICSKFIEFLGDCQDPHQQDNLVNKIFYLADKFRPSFVWYIDTIDQVLKTGLVELNSSLMATVLKNLRKAKMENLSEEVWNKLVEKYTREELLVQEVNPSVTQLIVWILQECRNLCTSITDDNVNRLLCALLEAHATDKDTLIVLFSCILQFVLQTEKSKFTELLNIVKKFNDHSHFIIRQYALEIDRCCDVLDTLKSQGFQARLFQAGELKIDPFLSHQDEFVIQALEGGSKPYCNKGLVTSSQAPFSYVEKSVFNFEADDKSPKNNSVRSGSFASDSVSIISIPSTSSRSEKGKKKQYYWTKEGLQTVQQNNDATSEEESNAPEPQPANEKETDDLQMSLFAGVAST